MVKLKISSQPQQQGSRQKINIHANGHSQSSASKEIPKVAPDVSRPAQMTIDDFPDDDVFLNQKDPIEGNINDVIETDRKEKEMQEKNATYAFEQWRRNITLARDALLTSDMYVGVARNFADMPDEYRKLAEYYGQLAHELDRLEAMECELPTT